MTTPDYGSDGWLDAQLRNVPLPDGLLRGLTGAAMLSDEELDAALRDVPLPPLLLWRLRRIVEAPARLIRLRQWAAAASLFLAIGFSYITAVMLFLACHYPSQPEPVLLPGPFVALIEMESQPLNLEWAPLLVDASSPGDDDAFQTAVSAPNIELSELASRREGPLGFKMFPFGSSSGIDPLLDAELSRWLPAGSLGSHRGFDDLPEPKRVPGLAPRGISPPLVPYFDIFFFRDYGIHPFVRPAMHPALCVSQVPLAVNTSSYELARRYLEDGMLPPRSALRTEEFLAAVDYGYPQPKNGQAMALFAAAGPSPSRGGDLKLLQLGVQAAQVYDKARPGTRLTLVVDVSTSMQWGGRLEMVLRALGQVAQRMGPHDRISLVVFNEYASSVGEDVARDEMSQLLEVFRGIPAQGSTNVGAGLRLACAVAGRYAATDRTVNRVMLLTDGLAELDGGTSGHIEQRLREAAARGIRLDAVDLGQEKVQEQLDEQLVRFATAGGGKVLRATSADQVGWAVLETITGQSQLVASEARLRVAFNPETVFAYRLLGHEAKAIVGLMPARTEADFRSGQAATALYEVRLNPGGGNDVALAELTWSDPRTGQPHVLTRKLQRSDFAATSAQAPLALQAAIVVSQAVEVLRDSPFAPVPQSAGGLNRVLELARQVDSRLYQRPSFAEFVAMLEQAVKARPYRSGGRR